jgi:hypothetical protein
MLLCIFSGTAFTQAKSGIENYNLLSQGKEYLWMPVAHYQSTKGIYAELRYNYEDVQTVSLYGGRAFDGGNAVKFTLIPMIGFSVGKFTGVSLATNVEAECKKFYLSSQTQYSMATKKDSDGFFFSWSEVGYSLSDIFFAGIAVQYTMQKGINNAEPGFVAGLDFKNISIPVYVFSPFKKSRYFVVGLNYEFDFKKK